MKKLLFYSHDTYGLGNIRRTISICKFLMTSIPDLSILIITGSPMIHSFRIPNSVDYIKLPCLTRTDRDGYVAKFLDADSQSLLKLRAALILNSVANFTPDLVMVDKKPYGVQDELKPTLSYIHNHLPKTKVTLLLRDVLDSPAATRKIWKKHGFFEGIDSYYDEIFVLGCPEVFDPREEYRFPLPIRKKTRFCGYLRREPGLKNRTQVRGELGLSDHDELVLVTAGGGEDGACLFEHYLGMVKSYPNQRNMKSLMVLGPELPTNQREFLSQCASRYGSVRSLAFTDDLMSYMDASDLVVSMGGYGTVCEILSLNKRAIVVPRVRPVEEQWIRASRMAQLGLFTTVHPDKLTPHELMQMIQKELNNRKEATMESSKLALNALPQITMSVLNLLMKAGWQETSFSNIEKSRFPVTDVQGAIQFV